MKGYTNKEKLQIFLNDTISNSDAIEAIESAEAMIDLYTGRNFKADSTDVERYFNGDGKSELCIDECISISKVEVGLDEWGDNFLIKTKGGFNGYYLLPENYEARGLPINALLLRNDRWTTGKMNHRITAKWGFSKQPPLGIVTAATILAGGVYNYNRGSGGGTIQSESIGSYSVSYATDKDGGWAEYNRALKILDGLRKYNL